MTKENNHTKSYSIWTLICVFAIFALGGWLWEVCLHLIIDGEFINRGTLYGPWIPIYGVGAVITVLLLNRFKDKPIRFIINSIFICGILEYLTSYFLEVITGMRWWDYTENFLNINGRVCLAGLLIFVVFALLDIYIVLPATTKFTQKGNGKIVLAMCVIFMVLFALDMIYSFQNPNIGIGITY